jgi:hypothetical protein
MRIMKNNLEKYPEPPELRRSGVPPLMKIIKIISIAVAIAFVIVLLFSIFFKLKNG